MKATSSLSLPPHWPKLLSAVERPETALTWVSDPGAWADFLVELTGQGLFPLAYAAWRASGLLASLPPWARGEAEARMNRYRAGSAAAWGEIERTLDLLRTEGCRPILLKGAHLALRYYAEPHLRPLSDLDLLFESPGEAERAFAALEREGYRRAEPGIPLPFWSLSQHLPDLVSPGAAFPVELHGALVYAPGDDRWKNGASCLLEGLREFRWGQRNLRALSPEALVVHLCGHAFLQHASEPPKAGVLFDLRAVLEREGDSFSWDCLTDLAERSGMGAAVARGLRWLSERFAVPLPEEPLGRLGAGREAVLLRLPPREAATANLLSRLRHEGLGNGLRAAFRIAFPPAAFMRERYPGRKGWPLPALYPARWVEQAGKLGRWALALRKGR